MTGVVIASAVRTPIGRHGGALAGVRPDDLAALVIRAAVERARVPPARVDDVILGCSNQAGEDSRNVGRMAALLAELPVGVPGQTVNRLCGSGMQAIISGVHAIRAGEAECVVAGGVESMTRAPWITQKPDRAYPRAAPVVADSTIGWRFTNPAFPAKVTVSMGATAENVAARWKVSREEQDRFALESQQRAARAISAGRFMEEIIAVPPPGRPGLTVDRNEHPRPETTAQHLGGLKPAFAEGGTVTAGNASGINDGASALVLLSEGLAAELNAASLGRVVASAVAGVAPEIMGIGPVPAVQKALARAGWTAADLELVELNEAFASQAVACIRELELDPERVNVNGGAIALGHPLGASGARIVTTLVHEMRRRSAHRGLAAMCIGVGQGIALLVERP